MWDLRRPSICSGFLLALLLFSITQNTLTTFTKDNCTELTNQTQCKCSCSSTSQDINYDIKCPKEQNQYTITIQWFIRDQKSFVFFDCNKIDANSSDYNILPTIDIANISLVKIQRCPLSGGLLPHFLQRLGLTKLHSLEVSDKDLNVLGGSKILAYNSTDLTPKESLMNTKQLITFYLNYNKKVKLAQNIFAEFESLETLMLDHNNLQQLPGGVFREQRKLKKLNLSYNQLRNLSEDVFKGATLLSTLDLSLNSKIQNNSLQLPKNIFADLQNLETLELFQNNLKQLPAGIFRNQHKLRKLDLSCNQLRNLSKDVFEGATSLSTLNLSLNGIESFKPEVFSLLTNLSEIYLNGNNISTLPTKFFIENKNLNKIYMKNNSALLTALPSALFANLKYLLEVSITCNANASDLFDDLMIDLSDIGYNLMRIMCGINEIPGDIFANSSKFTSMILANNALSSLPETLFKSQNKLLRLNLSSNKLQTLPDDLFKDTTKLKLLILSYNQLDGISEKILSYLINLKWLYMDNNRLLTINPSAFTQTTNIIYLSMANNQLHFDDYTEKAITFPFHYLNKLQTLNLRNNTLRHVKPDWRDIMHSMKMLDLSLNKITSLSYHDFEFTSANEVYINMSHNQIKLLNFTNTKEYLSLIHYDSINLDSNPIVRCYKLMPFMRSSNGIFPQKPLRCPIDATHSAPDCKCREYSNDTVLFVNMDLEKAPPLKVIIPVTIVGVLIALIAALCCKYRRKIKLWLHKHSICLCLLKKKDLDKYDILVSYSQRDA